MAFSKPMQFTLPSIVSENDFCRHIIAHSKNEGREFFVTGMVLQAWNLCAGLGTAVRATVARFCVKLVRMEAPPVPEPYASMSVEDKIDFIAQNILREYNSK